MDRAFLYLHLRRWPITLKPIHMAKTVTIYSTKTCGYCQAAKQYLSEQNFPYTEHDVGADSDKAREMIEKSGQMGVPVIAISDGTNEEIIVGFDRNRLATTLGLAA